MSQTTGARIVHAGDNNALVHGSPPLEQRLMGARGQILLDKHVFANLEHTDPATLSARHTIAYNEQNKLVTGVDEGATGSPSHSSCEGSEYRV